MRKEVTKTKKEMTIDDLAFMVQNGFLSLEEKITEVRKELKSEFKKEIREAKEELKVEINKKVDIFSHRQLEYRVEKVEEKVKSMVRDE